MNEFENQICDLIDGNQCQLGPIVQELWSGYGVIQKAVIDGQPVIIKAIDAAEIKPNRRGWKSDFAHLRKVRSYDVETVFYQKYSLRCGTLCRVAKLLGSESERDRHSWLLILEDLDSSGFGRRESDLSDDDIESCLTWLANFHATFIGVSGRDGLWPTGTYWHLGTRPDEFRAMSSGPLKDIAIELDFKLNGAKYQTLVHGDAKVANFCFGDKAKTVAAVDFQYVGAGVGIKDVAYFVSSCLDELQAEQREGEILNYYFRQLRDAIQRNQSALDADAIEKEWRKLYPIAWADFCRFLQGWSPGHWKLNGYSKRMTEIAIGKV